MVNEKEIIGKQAYLRIDSWMWHYDDKGKRKKLKYAMHKEDLNTKYLDKNSPVFVLAISGAYAMVTEKKGCTPFVCRVKELHTEAIV